MPTKTLLFVFAIIHFMNSLTIFNNPLFTTDLRHIITNRFLTVVGQSFLAGFSVIYIFQVSGEQLWVPISLYIAASVIYLCFSLFSKPLLNYVGQKKSLIIGVLFRILMWSSLFLSSSDTWMYWFPLLAFSIAMTHFWYWPTYNNWIASLTTEENRTSVLSLIQNIANILGMFMPIIVGYMISLYGFDALFLVATMLIILSTTPLLLLKDINVTFSWSPRDIINQILLSGNRRFVITEISNGFEYVFANIMWPIVIYILLSGDFLSIGYILSLTTIAVIILNILVGKFGTSSIKNKIVLKYASVLHALGWVAKVFVETAAEMFAARAVSRGSSSITALSENALSMSYSRGKRDFSDETMTLRQISMNIGVVIALVLIAILTLFIPLQWIFIFAALASLVLNVMPVK